MYAFCCRIRHEAAISTQWIQLLAIPAAYPDEMEAKRKLFGKVPPTLDSSIDRQIYRKQLQIYY